MEELFDSNTQDLVEKQFRDTKLECKIISYILRKDNNIVFSIFSDCFTIEPYQVIFEIARKNKMNFTKDVLYRFVKEKIDKDKLDIYKTYIIKIYNEDISKISKKNVDVFVLKLKELFESRAIFKSINRVISNIEKFNLSRAKDILRKSIYSDTFKDKKYYGEYLEDFEERRDLIEYRQKHPEKFSGIPTGVSDFDKLSGGIMKGEFGVIIAGTGVGKSVALGNFAVNAWKRGYNVLFISLEMTKHQIQYRMDSRISKIYHKKFRQASLDNDDLKKWETKIKLLREKKKNFLEIVCLPKGCCSAEIEEEAIKIQSKRGQQIDLILVDYLNLMTANDDFGNKRDWKHQANVAWDLKHLSMEFNGVGVPIWTANQLTDEGAKAKKLETYHVKYARAISEVAPIIIAFNQTVDDQLQDVIKLWIIKCRDFEKIKKPIMLHPQFNIMVLNQEMINIAPKEEKSG